MTEGKQMVEGKVLSVPDEELVKMKVVELQSMLRDLGESAKGVKADLIQRIKEAQSKEKESPSDAVKMKPLRTAAKADESPAAGEGDKAEAEPIVEEKGKNRVIALRKSGGGEKRVHSGSTEAVEPAAKKGKAGSGEAVTSDSIQALADELGVGDDEKEEEQISGKRRREEPDKEKGNREEQDKGMGRREEPKVIVRGRGMIGGTAAQMGGRMRSDATTGGHRSVSTYANNNAARVVRTDGVRGRGTNRFAIVTEESKREEPPQQQPQKVLKLEGLRRPFTDRQLKDRMGEFGEVTWFWLNRIKSICFVEYGSVQEASHARDEVYDVQWPENTGEKVKANFCTRSEADTFTASEPSAKPIGARLGVFPPGPPTRKELEEKQREADKDKDNHKDGGKEKDKDKEHEISGEAYTQMPRNNGRNAPLEREKDWQASKPKRVEDLFKKTKAKPEIYWVPISSELATTRLEKMRGADKPPPPPPAPPA